MLTVLFGLCSLVTIDAQGDEAKVYINKASYLVKFEKTRKGLVHATVDVRRNFVSQTALKFTISEGIFFDDYSEIKKLKKNGKKVKPIISDYQSDGIFHSDLKLCYIEHTFNTSGEEAKITYQKKYTDIKYLDPMYFVDRYEIDDVTIEIRKPDWLELNIVEWNFDLDEVSKSEKKDGDKTIYTYNMKDLNSYTKVKGLPSQSKVYAHLILNPVAANIKGARITLLENTADLYKWYAGLVNQIGNDASSLKHLVSELTSGKTEDLEKIKEIYYWVQDNIRYIAFESGIMGFRPEACQSVYTNKYGDCKGMANLTKEMLKIAGYDARLTWIGTNTLPYDYTLPSLIVDNHMICTVILDGEQIFLDATQKNADLYYYASGIQGKEVMIENGDSYIISKIPEDKGANKKRYTSKMVIEEDLLTGNGEVVFSGGKKALMAYYLSSIAAKDQLDFLGRYLSNGDKNINVDIIKQDIEIKREQPYQIDYNMTIANRTLIVGNELYFNPEVDFAFREFTKLEDRDIPYDMSEESVVESEMAIAIPAGYSVSYLPATVTVSGDSFSFDLSYEEQDGIIYYRKNINIIQAILQPTEFATWNKLIDQLQTFYSDQIILKKS